VVMMDARPCGDLERYLEDRPIAALWCKLFHLGVWE